MDVGAAGKWECVIAPREGHGGVKLVAPTGEIWWVIGNASALAARLNALEALEAENQDLHAQRLDWGPSLDLQSKFAAATTLLRQAKEHMAELRDAWQRGALSEHDGKGGLRSNRNWDLLAAITAYLMSNRAAVEILNNLEAENARLKAALEEIAKSGSHFHKPSRTQLHLSGIARVALESVTLRERDQAFEARRERHIAATTLLRQAKEALESGRGDQREAALAAITAYLEGTEKSL